jgi:hypothetical protein
MRLLPRHKKEAVSAMSALGTQTAPSVQPRKNLPHDRIVLKGTRIDSVCRFTDLSFPTISASGPNGAINHYFVNEATNRRLQKSEVLAKNESIVCCMVEVSPAYFAPASLLALALCPSNLALPAKHLA